MPVKENFHFLALQDVVLDVFGEDSNRVALIKKETSISEKKQAQGLKVTGSVFPQQVAVRVVRWEEKLSVTNCKKSNS